MLTLGGCVGRDGGLVAAACFRPEAFVWLPSSESVALVSCLFCGDRRFGAAVTPSGARVEHRGECAQYPSCTCGEGRAWARSERREGNLLHLWSQPGGGGGCWGAGPHLGGVTAVRSKVRHSHAQESKIILIGPCFWSRRGAREYKNVELYVKISRVYRYRFGINRIF